jgi:formate hydrogenlyase subunit 6/NADH:ubiquinone oxidoreductase subunit I
VEGREGKFPKINYGTCSLCGYCVDFCPTKALEHTDLVEYSTRIRKDLIYPPEKLAQVPSIQEVVPRLKRRIKPIISKGSMKYVEAKKE